jgi:hypothetical protein
MQAGLRHDEEMREAKAAAEAKLAEVLEESANANAVLLAELEEERKERKAVEHRMELMTTDHKEYDRLVMQIDALARRKLFCPRLSLASSFFLGSMLVFFFFRYTVFR